jgi:hypothetical protein
MEPHCPEPSKPSHRSVTRRQRERTLVRDHRKRSTSPRKSALPLTAACLLVCGCSGASDKTERTESTRTTASAFTTTPSSTKWFVALCNSSDNPPITPGRDFNFYSNLFWGHGVGSVSDYYSAMSYGHVNFANSVLTSWVNTGQTQAWHSQQSASTNLTTCVNAALAATNSTGINFFNYVAIYNFKVTEQSDSVTIQGKTVPAVILDKDSPETGILHEMGHGFGLGHSYNDQNVQYGDPFDVMSAITGVYSTAGNFCVPTGGWYTCDNGPGLNMFTRAQLGWLSPGQSQMWWPATNGLPLMTENLTLAARNEAANGLPQMLYVPATSTTMYTVEWVDSDNYDQDNLVATQGPVQTTRTPANTLIIHKITYGNQTTYLVTAPGGTQTGTGNPFYDTNSGVHIQLISTQGSPVTATVQISVDSTNAIWANGATSGTPPVDPRSVVWTGVDPAAGDTAVPANAIYGGNDANAGSLYPCRTWFNGVQLGKVVWGECSFPWGGSEHFTSGPFETITSPSGNYSWVSSSNGSPIPANAVAAGFDGSNTLYVCTAVVNGNYTPGKLIWGQCDVSWGGQEIWNQNYLVLTAP